MSSQVPCFIGAVEDGEDLAFSGYIRDTERPLTDWAMFR
jgi:hypothetical protein